MSAAAPKPRRRFWRVARRIFRWCRIAVWLLLLTVILLLLWMHQHGLPAFARDRLVAELRLRGVELRFTRMRLVWYRGIVADNIRFGRTGETNGPRASATEAEVHLRLRSLLHREIDIEGVALRGGRVILPVWGTNDTPQELEITKVSGELKFLPGDEWELSRFQAETFGVGLRLRGTVTNATAVRGWKFGRARPKEKTPEAFWHDLVRQFERTQFGAASEIFGTVSGDARHLDTFRVNLNVRAPAIESPWGRGSNFILSAQISPQPGALIYAEVKLSARDADTPWGRAASVELDARLTPSLTQWTPTNAHVDLQVKRAQTPWGSASELALQADFRPNPSDQASALADYKLRGRQIQTPWVKFAQAELASSGVVSVSNAWPSTAKTTLNFAGGEIAAGRAAAGRIETSLTLPSWNEMRLADTNLSWWTRLEKISGDLGAELTAIHTPRLGLTNLTVSAAWQPPALSVRDLVAALYDGELRGHARLDTATRALTAEMKSDFDPRHLAPLLTTNGRPWLTQFTWQRPPRLAATIQATLPPWTNATIWKDADWRGTVLPTLGLGGSFAVGPATFRGLDVSSAQSDFSYSNRIWRLPNLLVTRPGEEVRLAHVTHDDTGNFEFIIDSTADPRVLRPFFQPPVQRVVDDFTFTTPPVIHAEIAGRWSELERITARAQFAVTNAGYRARAVLSCRTLVTFTNMVLGMIAPEVIRAEGIGRAESVVIDIPRMKLFINHGTGRLHVADVTHVISPGVEQLMAPYRFPEAPQSRAHGVVDLDDGLRSDLLFHVEGGAFEWRAFRFQTITGDVHWAGPVLTFSNVTGALHGGSLDLAAAFDFAAGPGARFSFDTRVRDLNFHSLMSDLNTPTNQLEGTLNGRLTITSANSEDARSWFGAGEARLEDGLIWDVPALGYFSPILNLLKPGSGNSRAREVAGTFLITNSVIFTDDLIIHASGMRLNYDGTVDFETQINGRMEAQLLHDMPGLGPLISTVFKPLTKLFEYKVAGTLARPKSQPLYIPKIIMMPFHPLRSLRELMGDDKEVPPLRGP